VELLAAESADGISVTQLCEAADVRRTTFYTHYDTIDALLEDVLQTDVAALLSGSEAHFTDLSVTKLDAALRTSMRSALALIDRDRNLFRAAFLSRGSAAFVRGLQRVIAERVERILVEFIRRGLVEDIDRALVTQYGAAGMVALLESWCLRDESENTPERWLAAFDQVQPAWWPKPT